MGGCCVCGPLRNRCIWRANGVVVHGIACRAHHTTLVDENALDEHTRSILMEVHCRVCESDDACSQATAQSKVRPARLAHRTILFCS